MEKSDIAVGRRYARPLHPEAQVTKIEAGRVFYDFYSKSGAPCGHGSMPVAGFTMLFEAAPQLEGTDS